jgi:hypothetical protein
MVAKIPKDAPGCALKMEGEMASAFFSGSFIEFLAAAARLIFS